MKDVGGKGYIQLDGTLTFLEFELPREGGGGHLEILKIPVVMILCTFFNVF